MVQESKDVVCRLREAAPLTITGRKGPSVGSVVARMIVLASMLFVERQMLLSAVCFSLSSSCFPRGKRAVDGGEDDKLCTEADRNR